MERHKRNEKQRADSHDGDYGQRARGVVGRGRGGGDGAPPPLFFDRGDASHTPPHFFGLKFVQKLVHCCNWLLTETQCKTISVQQN